VPLITRLENQVTGMTDDDRVAKLRTHCSLKYETVFVLAVVPVHGRAKRPRPQRMLDKGEAMSRIVAIDEKARVGTTEKHHVAITRTDDSRSRHGPSFRS
jgi:hypothetical protein